jgi:hypothetical protein
MREILMNIHLCPLLPIKFTSMSSCLERHPNVVFFGGPSHCWFCGRAMYEFFLRNHLHCVFCALGCLHCDFFYQNWHWLTRKWAKYLCNVGSYFPESMCAIQAHRARAFGLVGAKGFMRLLLGGIWDGNLVCFPETCLESSRISSHKTTGAMGIDGRIGGLRLLDDRI